jgi:hypothetical protein
VNNTFSRRKFLGLAALGVAGLALNGSNKAEVHTYAPIDVGGIAENMFLKVGADSTHLPSFRLGINDAPDSHGLSGQFLETIQSVGVSKHCAPCLLPYRYPVKYIRKIGSADSLRETPGSVVKGGRYLYYPNHGLLVDMQHASSFAYQYLNILDQLNAGSTSFTVGRVEAGVLSSTIVTDRNSDLALAVCMAAGSINEAAQKCQTPGFGPISTGFSGEDNFSNLLGIIAAHRFVTNPDFSNSVISTLPADWQEEAYVQGLYATCGLLDTHLGDSYEGASVTYFGAPNPFVGPYSSNISNPEPLGGEMIELINSARDMFIENSSNIAVQVLPQ